MRIETTIATQYVPDWDVDKAIRELYANAVDVCTDNESSKMEMINFDYPDNTQTTNCLAIRTTDSEISRRHLAMGVSDKSADTIGNFGEGLKLACLVLARKGLNVKIFTGQECWNVTLAKHSQLGVTVLCYDISNDTTQSCDEYFELEGEGATTIYVTGNLSEKDINGCMSLTIDGYNYQTLHTTEFGEILEFEDGKKRLFVGDMFICELHSEYSQSYNFKPNFITLNRDRALPNMADVGSCAVRAWIESKDYHKLSMMIVDDARECSDSYVMGSLDYYIPNKDHGVFSNNLTKACTNCNGTNVMPEIAHPDAKYETDAPTMKAHQVRAIKSMGDNVNFATATNNLKSSPNAMLREFLARHMMYGDERTAFDKLIEASKNWRKR